MQEIEKLKEDLRNITKETEDAIVPYRIGDYPPIYAVKVAEQMKEAYKNNGIPCNAMSEFEKTSCRKAFDVEDIFYTFHEGLKTNAMTAERQVALNAIKEREKYKEELTIYRKKFFDVLDVLYNLLETSAVISTSDQDEWFVDLQCLLKYYETAYDILHDNIKHLPKEE